MTEEKNGVTEKKEGMTKGALGVRRECLDLSKDGKGVRLRITKGCVGGRKKYFYLFFSFRLKNV